MFSSNLAWRVGKTQAFKLSWFKRRTFYIGGWCDLLSIGSILDLLNRFLMTTANSWNGPKTVRQMSRQCSVQSARTPHSEVFGSYQRCLWAYFHSPRSLLFILLAVLPQPSPDVIACWGCSGPPFLQSLSASVLHSWCSQHLAWRSSPSYLLWQEYCFPPRLSVCLPSHALTQLSSWPVWLHFGGNFHQRRDIK